MIIKSSCTGELCKKLTPYYQWYLFKKDSENSEHPWKEVTDLENRTLTDQLDNPHLVLKGQLSEDKYSLDMNSTYKINASISVGEDRFPSNEITVKTIAPLSIPKKTCEVTPHKGVVLETNFTVDCSGWHAENVNLTYLFRYV